MIMEEFRGVKQKITLVKCEICSIWSTSIDYNAIWEGKPVTTI